MKFLNEVYKPKSDNKIFSMYELKAFIKNGTSNLTKVSESELSASSKLMKKRVKKESRAQVCKTKIN